MRGRILAVACLTLCALLPLRAQEHKPQNDAPGTAVPGVSSPSAAVPAASPDTPSPEVKTPDTTKPEAKAPVAKAPEASRKRAWSIPKSQRKMCSLRVKAPRARTKSPSACPTRRRSGGVSEGSNSHNETPEKIRHSAAFVLMATGGPKGALRNSNPN
jgi:hypothetical protein